VKPRRTEATTSSEGKTPLAATAGGGRIKGRRRPLRRLAFSTLLIGLAFSLTSCDADGPPAAGLQTSATPSTPSRPERCTYDSASHTATLRNPLGILLNRSGKIRYCGEATVSNTDTIHLLPEEELELSIDASTLSPGFTPEETGLPEIEVFVQTEEKVSLWIEGSSLKESFILGTGGLNFNGDDDVDLVVEGRAEWTLYLYGGDDFASTMGKKSTGSPFLGDVGLIGHGGRDVLIAGRIGAGFAEGNRGDDRIIAGRQTRGRQYLDGGKGRDFIRGGPGVDNLVGGDGRDRLTGGPGFDSCQASGADVVYSCERARD
jgi:hypothetical protein